MIKEFAQGGYCYIPGVFQYSAGVAALDGFQIERVRFSRPVPLETGFALAERYIREADRPLSAFCACELRSPEPFSENGFSDFNERYVEGIRKFGLFADGENQVARSNVCPEYHPPASPHFYSFCFTRSNPDAYRSFVIAGSAEVPEGTDSYSANAISPGDTSPDGLREKTRWVLGEMGRRMDHFGMGWTDTSAVQVYTVHDVFALFGSEIVPLLTQGIALEVHLNRPPVKGLEYEMDCRRVRIETVLAV